MAQTRQSAQDRVTHFTDKLVPQRVHDVLVLRLPSMQTGMRFWIAKMDRLRQQVMGVIAALAIPARDIAKYMAYGNELWLAKRNLGGGEQLWDEATLIGLKWAARGLNQTALDNIRTTVFAIANPSP